MSGPVGSSTPGSSPTGSTPAVIGLTGTVGAGKSTVATILRGLGCVICDSDALAREAFDDPVVIEALRSRWGNRAFDASGRPDRSAVAGIVFADPAERRWLESVVHPWIEARRAAIFAAAPPGTAALVIDAPLLLEAGLEGQCDQVWVVDAPVEVRQRRVATGREWDEVEFRRREASQWPADRKRAAATVLIDNGGSREDLAAAVAAALGRIRPQPGAA